MKINKTQTILKDPNYAVKAIGNMLGDKNDCEFSRKFKRNSGVSPMEFRRRLSSRV